MVAKGAVLDGVRVIELTHAIAGPQCGQILADHGADVIKVEPPTGERARNAYPRRDEESIYFACHNRGKRSVVLDLKDDDDMSRFRQLLAGADVILTNYTVDVPKRLGWDYDSVRRFNPSIVMAHITGFGATGPDRDLRAYDGIVQAMSGIAEASGTAESGPMFAGAWVADHIASYQAALGIMFALYRRKLTGEGEFVDIAMLESYAATSAHAIEASLMGEPVRPMGNKLETSYADTFTATDGAIFLAPLGQETWERFCVAIGEPNWVDEIPYEVAVFERREETAKVVATWCERRTRAEIADAMAKHRIPCGPVQSSKEYAEHALKIGSRAVVEVTAPSGQQFKVPGPIAAVGLSQSTRRWQVPGLGEHTDEVLTELDAQA